MRKVPEDIYFRGRPNTEDIRELLRELVDTSVSDETAKLFGALAINSPLARLVTGLTNTMNILTKRNVRHILSDGLTPEEFLALIELDDLDLSIESRVTARGLLCVKERYAMVKGLRGYFNSARQAKDAQIRV